jgi:hypothetical protein
VLRLLIDTSAWLDMATRREGQKWVVPLRVMKVQGKLDLLVPALIIEEYDRNRPRLESAVTTSVLDRLRQLRRELREYAGDQHQHIWLAETTEHIPLVNATTPQNFREIGELLRDGTILEPAEPEYTRAIQRGLGKRAPFTSDKNSAADALLIEIYASQIAEADSPDVYAFVTSNYRDFSVPNGIAASRIPTWPGCSTAPGHAMPTRWKGCTRCCSSSSGTNTGRSRPKPSS